MDITTMDFTLNDVTVSFLDLLNDNVTVPVSQTKSVEEMIVMDVCDGQSFIATIEVEAEPLSDGDQCQAEDTFQFAVTAVPSPVPVPVSPPISPPSSPGATEPCSIALSADCKISGNSSFAGEACDIADLGVEPCLERPTGAAMLFNGGGCEQSDNTQQLKFTCQDYSGGPPVNENDEAYIEVTDIKGLGIVYFSGIVSVGEIFRLNDAEERFEADMFVTISSPDQSTLLQRVQFHSSCSSNLELKNRFGASQLVEFINDLQGVVTCFATFSLRLDVAIPFEAESEGGGEIILDQLTADTSFAGLLDLTDQVQGFTLVPGMAPVVVELLGTIDATQRMTYSILYNVQGTRVSDNAQCTGMELVSFEAGLVPTSPTGDAISRRRLRVSF